MKPLEQDWLVYQVRAHLEDQEFLLMKRNGRNRSSRKENYTQEPRSGE